MEAVLQSNHTLSHLSFKNSVLDKFHLPFLLKLVITAGIKKLDLSMNQLTPDCVSQLATAVENRPGLMVLLFMKIKYKLPSKL